MDPWDNRFYSINRKLMSILGRWPYQDPKKRKFISSIFYMTTSSLMLTQVAQLATSGGDLDIIMEVIPIILTGCVEIAKLINCDLNRKKLSRLASFITTDWQTERSEEEKGIIKTYAEEGKFLVFAYTANIYFMCFGYSLLPILPVILDTVLPLNESRPRLYLYKAEYFVDNDSNFWPIMFHMNLVTYTGITIIVATDTLFMTYIQHGCTLFAIAGHRFKHAFDDCDESKIQQNDSIVRSTYKRIALCIDGHQRAINYSDLLHSTFIWAFFVEIGLVLCVLTLSLVQIVLNAGKSTEIVRYVCFVIGQLFHLFCNSFPGQRLQDHSLEVFEKAYSSSWYNGSTPTQQLLMFTMLRSTKPSVITAGGYYILCSQSFAMVVQTSMSYFTVVTSVQS